MTRLVRRRDRHGPCSGSATTFPVPPGYTPEQAWEEQTTLGRLLPYTGRPTWENHLCSGGPLCDCRGSTFHWLYRHYAAGRLVSARWGGLVLHWIHWRRR